MSKECELISKCGFFKKYQSAKVLACKGFILNYCKGSQMNQCKRKEYRQKHGSPPSDDMMPTGQMIAGTKI
ncbi:MAG: hypothetical protein ACOY4W_00165 [Thermodesulfobacteriota bacterium]|jgi:hypothetical protein